MDDTGGGDYLESSPRVVVMEGALKKRGANLPLMRDRYCVATWETLARGGKAVVLRTYKSQKHYRKHAHEPVSVHTLKCVSDWSGKGNFHKYPFGFVMETDEHKLFHCAAPTQRDKDKWIELMTTVTTPRTATDEPVAPSTSTESDTRRAQDVGERGGLFSSDEDESSDGKPRRWADPDDIVDAENELLSGEDDEARRKAMDRDEDEMDEEEVDEYGQRRQVSPLALSPVDDKLLFREGSSDDLGSPHERRSAVDANEPEDWGIYGEKQGDGPSQYDVVDGPVMSLDKELLNGLKPAAPLASDDFLFEQNGPTFGAVVVPASAADDAENDFVDPVLQERKERKKKEKQLKRVAKKLESNRDLYAEMAAARLKSMRKDAKTKPRQSITHRRRGEEDDDSIWTSDGDDELESHHGAPMVGSISRHSSATMVHAEEETPKAAAVAFELEEVESEEEAYLRRQSAILKKKEKREKRQAQAQAQAEAEAADEVESQDGLFDDLLFGDASVPVSSVAVEETEIPVQAVEEEEEDEEEARRRRKERRRLKKQQQLEEAARLEEEERLRLAAIEAAAAEEPKEEEIDEEQRAIEKQRRKEERRRLRKERERREEAEAAAAEELARQQREAMRLQEEEELRRERKERKERKKSKEKTVLDKKAKELKKREEELAAEAEKLKQTQEALLKAEESKDSRKKKRRDKYTSPADRIHRREMEAEALASEMSTALVVVEQPAPTPPQPTEAAEPVTAPVAPVEAPAPTVESTPVVLAEIPVTPPVATPAPVTAPAPEVVAPPQSAPVAATPAAPAPAVPTPPQSSPAQFTVPAQPGFFPGFPAVNPYQVPMPYAAPYPAVHYNPGFPAVPYGAGMAMPTPYYPHLGYVGGIAPMNPAQLQASFAMMQPPSSTASSTVPEEEPFIGPQLPSPKSIPTAEPAPQPAAPPAPVPVSKSSAGVVLPDLPDVASF